MTNFNEVKSIFIELCKKHGFPVPTIKEAYESDPCDFTSPEEVRINIIAAKGIDAEFHAKHVFGHYVANLEQVDKWSDRVANFIAEVV